MTSAQPSGTRRLVRTALPRRTARLLRTALALALCALPCAAQFGEADPRTGTGDPRAGTGDPRSEGGDPRQADVDAQNAARTDRIFGEALFEDLYAGREFPKLSQAVATQPWMVLPWIDGMTDQWLILAQVEGDDAEAVEARADAALLRTKLLEVTQLCDKALGETTFNARVERMLAWDAEQIAAYRRGQAFYAEAVTTFVEADSAQAALAARTPLERCIEAFRPLDTTWDSTAAMALMGRIQMANREFVAAKASMQQVVKEGLPVRQLDAVWEGLNVLYQTALQNAHYDEAQEVLKEQYRISVETGDQGLADTVLQRLRELTDFRVRTGL